MFIHINLTVHRRLVVAVVVVAVVAILEVDESTLEIFPFQLDG